MPSRRDLIRMTPAEMDVYLRGQRRMIVCTICADGMPHPMPMNFGLDDAGRVIITTFAKSQKAVNLRRDPRATLLVESGDNYAEFRAAILFADAELIDDPAAMPALMQHIGSGGVTGFAPGTPRHEQVRASMAKRVVVRLTPFRTVSWDHAKLGAHY